MEYRRLGGTTEKVSTIGMGTWRFGSYRSPEERAKQVESLRRGVELGINLIDTAEIYASGRSEEVVGEAIHRTRKSVFLATKVAPVNLHHDDVIRACRTSLRRLGVSYIDLYQIHWPNPMVPIRETMSAMEKLVEEGKLRNIGVSNFNLKQLQEAQSSLSKAELGSVQLDYSLIHRRVEHDVLPYCERENIALLAYYPLGHGKLPSDSRLQPLSSSRGKTKAQVALRWLADKPNVFPIPRASRPDHVRENAGASDWELSSQERAELDMRYR